MSQDKDAAALAVALDIRKFEIDLYWKRAAYFWVFNGAALAGHLTALAVKRDQAEPRALLATACIGAVFAFAWYLVNRASKFWQSNWENHVDRLESNYLGPLYQTILSTETKWWTLNAGFPLSVSKINQLLSLFVFLVFVLLAWSTANEHYEVALSLRKIEVFPTACLCLTLGTLVSLVAFGQSSAKNRSASGQRLNVMARQVSSSGN